MPLPRSMWFGCCKISCKNQMTSLSRIHVAIHNGTDWLFIRLACVNEEPVSVISAKLMDELSCICCLSFWSRLRQYSTIAVMPFSRSCQACKSRLVPPTAIKKWLLQCLSVIRIVGWLPDYLLSQNVISDNECSKHDANGTFDLLITSTITSCIINIS